MERCKLHNYRLYYLSFKIICILLFYSSVLAQWKWINPHPTGNDLNQVYFISQYRGWIIGANGTLLTTSDRGNTWNDVLFNTNYNFKRILSIDGVNMWLLADNIYPVLGKNTIFFSSNCGATWIEQYQDATLPDSLRIKFNDMHFRDHLHGFSVSGNGQILSTDDGAQTWQLQGKARDYDLRKIKFFNDSLGFVTGGSDNAWPYPIPYGPSLSMGIILRTTNNGVQWDTVYHDSINIQRVHFQNAQVGWALGHTRWAMTTYDYRYRDYLLHTSNGGEYWEITQSIPAGDIHFIDNNHGWIAGDAHVARTTNGGLGWIYSFPAEQYLGPFNSVQFTDSLFGYIAGDEGVIVQTTDGGVTWAHYDSKIVNSVGDVEFVNPDTGWFVGSEIFRTIDAGVNWNASGVTGINSIDCIDKNHCWACGNYGKIVFSSDVGETWIQQQSGTTANLNTIKFANSRVGWAGSASTNIFKTTDGGTTWFSQISPTNIHLNEIIIQDSQRVSLFGVANRNSQQNVYTTNGGLNWLSTTSIYPLFWLNPDTGWGKGSKIYRTFNGGQTWEAMGVASYNLFFVDANNGWTQGSQDVSRTTDGGLTWNVEIRTRFGLYDPTVMCFLDSSHGWAVGYDHLLRYGYTSPVVSNNSTLSTNYYQGWNMVSIPIRPHTFLKDSLYSSSSSFAYSYDTHYKQTDTLKPGIGYWLKFNSNETQAIEGTAIHFNTFNLSKGWNMFGGISIPIPVSSISVMPSGTSVSTCYQYIPKRGYSIVDTIHPGRGYWINVSQDCRFTLADSSVFGPSGNIIVDKTILELPPQPPEEINLDNSTMPGKFALMQNYPNPCNPSTLIRYEIPDLGIQHDVSVQLRIYNILGEVMTTLVDEVQTPGVKTVLWNTGNFPSGVYLYRMKAGNFSALRKLLILK